MAGSGWAQTTGGLDVGAALQDLEHDGSLQVDPVDGEEKGHLVNREVDLRVYVGDDGAFALTERVDATHRATLVLEGVDAAPVTTGDDLLARDGDGIQQLWLNGPRGVEHIITLDNAPVDAEGMTRLAFAVEGLHVDVRTGDLAWLVDDDGVPRFSYSGLVVFDAHQRRQTASFDSSASDQLQIVIALDDDAEFPLTIDPLAQTVSSSLSGTTSTSFGTSVAQGDFDGDGLADLVVGAPLFDNGAADTGRVTIFKGSAGGLLLTPVIANIDAGTTNFRCGTTVAVGRFDATAGLDVAIGCPGEGGGAGRVRIFFQQTGVTFASSPNVTLSDPSGGGLLGSLAVGDLNNADLTDELVTTGASGLLVFDLRSGSAADLVVPITGFTCADTAVAVLPHFNGDNFADVALLCVDRLLPGAPAIDGGGPGLVRVFTGQTIGLLNTTPAFDKVLTTNGGGKGVIVGADYDGDGDTDIVTGRPGRGGVLDILDNNAGTLVQNANSPTVGKPEIVIFDPPFFFAGDNHGSALAAGDVNGDRHDDIVVCDGGYDIPGGSAEAVGLCQVFRGGPRTKFPSGLDVVAALTVQGTTTLQPGLANPVIGSFRTAGAADVVVPMPQASRVDSFIGTAATTSSSNFFLKDSDDAFAHFGATVVVDDVNGDNKRDVIVGAPDFDGGAAASGAVFAFAGGTTMSTAPSWSENGLTANEQFGTSISVGRFRGNSATMTIAVGAPGFDNGAAADAGRVRLFTTTSGAFPTTNQVASQNLTGLAAGDRFGASIANTAFMMSTVGDGLAVGAPGSTTFGGYVALFLPPTTPGGAMTTLSVLRGNVEGCAGEFGFSVANAGNPDATNQTDLLVGARKCSNPSAEEGKAFLFLSQPAGGTPVVGFTFEPNQAGAHAGVVAGLGDFTGDGVDDFAVGIPDYTNGTVPNAGFVRVFKGVSGGSPVTAISPTTVFSGRCGSSIAPGHVLGGGAFVGNDLNFDGIMDMVEGEPTFSDDVATPNEGRLRGFFGAPAPDSGADIAVEGGLSGAKLGTAVAAGDINGDQQGDLSFGAPGVTAGQTEEGRVFVRIGTW